MPLMTDGGPSRIRPFVYSDEVSSLKARSKIFVVGLVLRQQRLSHAKKREKFSSLSVAINVFVCEQKKKGENMCG